MDNPKSIINLDNISHNIKQVRKQVNNAKILAILKANAYGHGAVKVAKHLDSDINIAAYGVSRYSEAIKLYNNGIKKPILLLEGVLSKEQLKDCLQKGFWLTVHTWQQLELLNKHQLFTKPVNIWLKIDTGMNRLGFNGTDYNNEIKLLLDCIENLVINKKIANNIVVMAHFACADVPNNDHSLKQLAIFKQLIKKYFSSNEKIIYQFSMANSAGVFAWPDSHFDWVRPGICLYGSSPLLNKTIDDLNLKPTMLITTKVISIKHIKAGSTVGYGGIWQAEKDTIIAIIACGYADCYIRLPSNNAYTVIKNTNCLILGRVSMDMMAIDVSKINDIKIGDNVELWGDKITIDEAAQYTNTSSYELYTKITARVVKSYKFTNKFTKQE